MLALARQYGLPRSIIVGGPWPEPGEPLWSADDLDAAIGYERWLAQRCPRCGLFPDELVDPVTKRRYDVDRYEPEVIDCPGCSILDRFVASFHQRQGDPPVAARMHRVMGDDEVPFPGVFGSSLGRPSMDLLHDHQPPRRNPLAFRI